MFHKRIRATSANRQQDFFSTTFARSAFEKEKRNHKKIADISYVCRHFSGAAKWQSARQSSALSFPQKKTRVNRFPAHVEDALSFLKSVHFMIRIAGELDAGPMIRIAGELDASPASLISNQILACVPLAALEVVVGHEIADAGQLLREGQFLFLESRMSEISLRLRYRQSALARGYWGDSVVNSVVDTLSAAIGFTRSRMPLWSRVSLRAMSTNV
jgi:hypothetical protein